jgi:hypothetical protein
MGLYIPSFGPEEELRGGGADRGGPRELEEGGEGARGDGEHAAEDREEVPLEGDIEATGEVDLVDIPGADEFEGGGDAIPVEGGGLRGQHADRSGGVRRGRALGVALEEGAEVGVVPGAVDLAASVVDDKDGSVASPAGGPVVRGRTMLRGGPGRALQGGTGGLVGEQTDPARGRPPAPLPCRTGRRGQGLHHLDG